MAEVDGNRTHLAINKAERLINGLKQPILHGLDKLERCSLLL
jgi:hypothetical protein